MNLSWFSKRLSRLLKAEHSVERRFLEVTPTKWLDRLCRNRPDFVIELICHWISERNPQIEERGLAPWKSTALVPVVKKLSKLSVVSILYLLNQDESLWKIYMPGVPGTGFINLKTIPYILLEVMYDLGGSEGRAKVLEIVQRSRQSVGGRKQGDILENFKTDTVIDIFENLPEFDVRMRLMFNKAKTVAFWLDYWDMKMRWIRQPSKSAYWLGKIPGERAFEIQKLMRELEFRREHGLEDIYERPEEMERRTEKINRGFNR